MEKCHQKTSTPQDVFSFSSSSSTPQDQDSDFEFGCFTAPESPCRSSPADHLFLNGRLLPHSFPPPPQPTFLGFSDTNVSIVSRTTSRTSSVRSKDSFMSSRSNSTNSSRSSASASSVRTSSSSENAERKLLYGNKITSNSPLASKVVLQQLYGSSQRWQHIMLVPGLKREDSRRSSRNARSVSGNYKKRDQELKKKTKKKVKQGLLKGIFTTFLVACRQCHAMEAPTKDDDLHL